MASLVDFETIHNFSPLFTILQSHHFGLESFNKNGQQTSLVYIHFKGSRLNSYFNEYESEATKNLHKFFLRCAFAISCCWILLQWWAPHLIKSKSSEPFAQVTTLFLRDTCWSPRWKAISTRLQITKLRRFGTCKFTSCKDQHKCWQALTVNMVSNHSKGVSSISSHYLQHARAWILNTGQISKAWMKKPCSRESSEVFSLLNGISILVIQKLNIIKSPEPSEKMINKLSW